MSKKSLADTIRLKREELGWSQAELAARAGTNQSTVDRLERGQTTNSKHLESIFLALNINRKQTLTIPVIGYVGGGQEVLAIDDHAKGAGIEEIDAPPGVENGIALVVRGSSMAPRYEDGDYIVIEKVFLDLQSLIGRTCYVKLTDGRCYLKTLAAGSRPGRYTLLSINGPDIPDVTLEQAFPVAWVKPRR